MGLPEPLLTHRRQNVVGIVVQDIERQVAVDAFEDAGTIQTARPARLNAVFDGLLRYLRDEIAGA